LNQPVRRRGDTDLAIDERKISGNAQRRGRNALLFHGTFLHAVDTELLETLLPLPSREPDYRRGRRHRDFVASAAFDPTSLKTALRRAWQAFSAAPQLPAERIRELVATKYARSDWLRRF
jgi:lipoate-protein ligase A